MGIMMNQPKWDQISLAIWIAALAFFAVLYGVWASQRNMFPAPAFNDLLERVRGLPPNRIRENLLSLPKVGPDTSTFLPSRVQPGLMLVSGVTDGPRNFIRVIDRDSEIVHEWHVDWFEIWRDEGRFPAGRRPTERPAALIQGKLRDDGDLVMVFETLATVRLDPCSNVEWKLDNLGHHSIEFAADESIWVGSEDYFPAGGTDFPGHEGPLRSWTAQQLSPEGGILEEIPMIQVLMKNDLLGLLFLSSLEDVVVEASGDTLHMNDVEPFPADMESTVFETGDLLLSLRNINTILVIDPESYEIKYRMTGPFLRHHDPDFAPGDRIVLLDNRNMKRRTGQGAYSRVLEIDVRSDRITEVLGRDAGPRFFTDIMGNLQLLSNGNYLITSSREGRVIEVDRSG